MYDHIIVAVDGSETSKKVISEAIQFVKKNPESFLKVIHVIDENVSFIETQPIMTPIELQEIIKKAGMTVLQNIESELRAAHIEKFETKLIETNAVRDRIAEKIVEEAKTWPANLIMIGTHGRRGFHRFFLGSVAEGVTRIAPVPVLLIRGNSS